MQLRSKNVKLVKKKFIHSLLRLPLIETHVFFFLFFFFSSTYISEHDIWLVHVVPTNDRFVTYCGYLWETYDIT